MTSNDISMTYLDTPFRRLNCPFGEDAKTDLATTHNSVP